MSLKKILLFSISAILFFFQSDAKEPEKSYTIVANKTKLPMLSPDLKDRQTLKIRLANGLEAYLISDPKADQSGAALSVNTGSWEDPSDFPGLAHFVEHMLFMGTHRYPKESEYQKYISTHGGMTNAFTDSHSTNFIFTVSNQAFPEALDRFSSFFKEPLFNPSGIGRELQAVNQEYGKNIEQDSIRQLYVLKELANPQHPFSRFNMGNHDTLSKARQNDLIEWFQNHYSANLMKLVMFSPLPMEKIIDLVLRDFSGIEDKKKPSFYVNFPAFKNEGEKKYVYIEPIKDTRSLTLVWELPSRFSHLKVSQPEQIVSYILGHEGNKSLLAQLKTEKLAESLSCGGTKLGDDLMMFFIDIELTAEGLTDIDQVISRCFQAIDNLQTKGVPSYLFNEIQKMAAIEYQYQSKEDLFALLMRHASQIQDEDFSTYPENTAVISQFNLGDIQEFVKNLTPQNAQYLIMAPSSLTGMESNFKEKWLNVSYSLKPISKDTLDKWKHIVSHSEIDLPPPNVFIPDNLTLVYNHFTPSNRLVPQPITLINNEKIHIYFAHDDKFGSPKISWSFNILTPAITRKNAESIVYGEIYVKSLKNLLDHISYPAKMAGLDYDITIEKNGIRIDIEGYSQNASRLLKEILATIQTYQPVAADFQILKDSQLRKYQNFAKEKPITQSLELLNSVVHEAFVTEKEKATALRKITLKKYEEFVARVFNQTYTQGVLYGNMTEEQGRELISIVDATFNHGIYPKEERLQDNVIVLSQDKGPYFIESYTKSQGNAVLLAIENETFSHKERAAQQILMQAMKEPFFSTLRTKQQTSYIVVSLPEEIERKLFNVFAVQSNTHDARDLLSRFEQFIEGYVQELGKTELMQEQFKILKENLILKYNEPAENLSKMGELLQTLAYDYDGNFNWINNKLKALQELTYEEFLPLAKQFIGKNNKRRLAILLKGEISKENSLSYTKATTWNMVRKTSSYEPR